VLGVVGGHVCIKMLDVSELARPEQSMLIKKTSHFKIPIDDNESVVFFFSKNTVVDYA
jgi:hypothetical protein